MQFVPIILALFPFQNFSYYSKRNSCIMGLSLLFGCEFKDKLPLGSFTMIDHMHAWLCLILKHYIHSVDPFTGLGPTDLTLHKFSVRNSYLNLSINYSAPSKESTFSEILILIKFTKIGQHLRICKGLGF